MSRDRFSIQYFIFWKEIFHSILKAEQTGWSREKFRERVPYFSFLMLFDIDKVRMSDNHAQLDCIHKPEIC